jgi:hypothetical protein
VATRPQEGTRVDTEAGSASSERRATRSQKLVTGPVSATKITRARKAATGPTATKAPTSRKAVARKATRPVSASKVGGPRRAAVTKRTTGAAGATKAAAPRKAVVKKTVKEDAARATTLVEEKQAEPVSAPVTASVVAGLSDSSEQAPVLSVVESVPALAKSGYRQIRLGAALGWAAAGLMAGAGVIHLAFAPDHIAEYLPFGVAFYVMGVGQIAAALAVVALGRSRRLLWGAVWANLGICGLWLVTRTVGLPIGAEHWTPEKVGLADSVCVVFQLAAAAVLGLMLGRRPALVRVRDRHIGLRIAATALAIFALAVAPVTIHASSTGHETHSASAMKAG